MVLEHAEVRQLARAFSVSDLAMLLRLQDLSFTKKAFVSNMLRQLHGRGKRKPAKRGFVDPVTDTLSAFGRSYTKTVLEAFDGGQITVSDVSRYLGLRVKHLSRIQESLRGARP